MPRERLRRRLANFATFQKQHIYLERKKAHLHCYVSDEIAGQAQHRAAKSGLSLSRYLAELVKRDADASANWPDGYFELFGTWEGAPLERFPTSPLEQRLQIK